MSTRFAGARFHIEAGAAPCSRVSAASCGSPRC
jgi:hypothetical protein